MVFYLTSSEIGYRFLSVKFYLFISVILRQLRRYSNICLVVQFERLYPVKNSKDDD